MILLIDNYDSFTHNLYQALGQLDPEIKVVRNDAVTIAQIRELAPELLVISPGPGYPKNAGISLDAIRTFAGIIPIFGVCLGHQSIVQAFGGRIVRAGQLMHGKASTITLDTDCPLFAGLPRQVEAARYHSLIAQEVGLPDCLKITARDETGQIMAVQHKQFPVFGVQFHPESVLTEVGGQILKNLLDYLNDLRRNSPKTALKSYLAQVVEGKDLTRQQAEQVMNILMSGQAEESQIGSFLTALRMKGETIEEITGLASGMRKKALAVRGSTDAIDIVGTGGDLSNSFNISTTSAFVVAGAGGRVAKHGNRSVSSRCGAADVLEALGVKIDLTPDQARECLEKIGVSFLFAQSFHRSMRFVGPTRKQIGIRTVFNILGPLTNPASTDYIVLGVYAPELVHPIAQVMSNLGVKRALIVYGTDRLDEISITAPTLVCQVEGDQVSQPFEVTPEECGLSRGSKEEIVGGTAAENAVITRSILNGTDRGTRRDIVLLNAGAALYTLGMAQTVKEGVALAAQSIDSGAALAKLEALKEITNSFEEEQG